ncbi:MAG TPA: hypothetical protein VMN36_15730, partial [Verrucomicrobiales bacterium]|nr:hypothetical protein [Verrucomicrobiales bacterium]
GWSSAIQRGTHHAASTRRFRRDPPGIPARDPRRAAFSRLRTLAEATLEVEHDPVQENLFDESGAPLDSNRAHSEVLGISSDSAEKKTERRLKLSRIWRWEIRLEI